LAGFNEYKTIQQHHLGFLKQIKPIDILHVEAYHFKRYEFIVLGLMKHNSCEVPDSNKRGC
jgi:hypothetical protein